jgi:predicted nucleotidyltransferase
VSAGNFDRSEWLRRDERTQRTRVALLASVRSQAAELQRILSEHGANEAYLFGSVAQGKAGCHSDVDIAVRGCPPEKFYRLAAVLEHALGLPLDLVDLDRAPADFAAEVRRTRQRIFSRHLPISP